MSNVVNGLLLTFAVVSWLKMVENAETVTSWVVLFSTYTIYTFSNKKFTVTSYFYIWTYLGSQSKILDKKTLDASWICVSSLRSLVSSFIFFNSILYSISPLSANPKKWSNTLKQFGGSCVWIIVGLAFKGLVC